MELILRARANGDRSADVVVDVEVDHTVSDLARALAQELEIADRSPALTVVRTGRALDPTSCVGGSGLVSGDEVVVGFGGDLADVAPTPVHGVSADVLAGPDAGTSTILLPGRYTVGRDPAADLTVDDPTVSRRHLTVDIGADWGVTVHPSTEAANRATVNDVELDAPCGVTDHDVIALGGTRLALRRFSRAPGERTDQLGQIEFQRTPYRPPTVVERAAPDLGPIPERREARRFQLLTALAPLAAGLTFFAFSRQPQFLILTLMTPLVMIAQGIEDRRSGRRTYRDDTRTFERRLVEWRAEIDRLLAVERVERLRAAPDVADLARRAELRTVDLWARGRDAPDFLRLRVGLGDVTPVVEPEVGRGGQDELRALAREALAGTELISDVPISVGVADAGVIGLHGPEGPVSGVAASMLVQAACLHSPEDLAVVAAIGPGRGLATWLKWLPHTRAVTSPLAGNHVTDDPGEVDHLVQRLLDVAEFRATAVGAGHAPGNGTDHRWPWILVALDAALHPDPADLARLLDRCPDVGISILWLADSAAEVPRQAAEVLAVEHGPAASLVGRMWSTDPGVPDRRVEVEQLRADIADRVARSLAPIRDASTASLASSIPRVVPLLDVLGVGLPTADGITERWLTRRTHGLPFPVGVGADGPLVLDLVEDGPHTLIGGTSGSGKSELVQSIVASLAAHHPPDRLNFLFVDYKGGASSNVFSVLPHTVGYVTNLRAELATRALTSLRAELNRRMRLLEGRAKDLAEMLDRHPDEAPPSLVIVVDEFATLVKEVPEFVDGVVDIAQRGRSLGIHLVLATQRPSGSVNDNILANTSLRISLRMLDRAESTAVLDSPEAADIPVPLRGRGYARLGPRRLVAFQSAFCGAPLVTGEVEVPVMTAPFVRTDDSPKAADVAPVGSETHLDAVLGAIVDAAAALGVAEPERPWRDELPELVTLGSVLSDPRCADAHDQPGRFVGLGVLDVPQDQDQRPLVVDLESGGGLVVYGSGGAGKTTTLRTVAVSLGACAEDGEVEIVGFDFASRGLASILPLPNVVDVAAGDDLEAVTRHLSVLRAELRRRRELLAAVHAENLTAYGRRAFDSPVERLPRIVVLIDGFDGLVSTFLGGPGGSSAASAVPLEAWSDVVCDLIVDGRQVGIHTVLTADRRSAVPTRIQSSIGNRLVLRHADEAGYADHGVPLARAKDLDLAPGRGLWQAADVVQVASVSADASGRAQGETIRRFAATVGRRRSSRLRSSALRERVQVDELPVPSAGRRVPVGIVDVCGDVAEIDLAWSGFTVVGSPRSGRSTLLSTCATALRGSNQVWAVGPASSPIDRTLFDEHAFGRPDVIGALLDRLANLLELGPGEQPIVLLVDDLDALDDMSLTQHWERLARSDVLRVIASVESRSLAGYTANPLLAALRRSRQLIVLGADDPNEIVQLTGSKSPVRPGQRLVPGRGVLVADGAPVVVQTATA